MIIVIYALAIIQHPLMSGDYTGGGGGGPVETPHAAKAVDTISILTTSDPRTEITPSSKSFAIRKHEAVMALKPSKYSNGRQDEVF